MVDTLDLKSNGLYRPWGFKSPSGYNFLFYFDIRFYARIAQLVEHDLAKVGVAGSSPVSRSFLQAAERQPFFMPDLLGDRKVL